MPRFSVIVPAYLVQEYLEECLDSVLSQSFDDFELIAVDDCSPDACGDLIDEYAARDPRVHPIHLAANGGLGNARNVGMEQAHGDYLLFLDSDDTLTPGALQSISDRLKESDSPDVLVFDYARTFWTGEAERNQFSGELHEQGPASFTLADRPGLLRVLMVAWNKAYSREFVEHRGFTFPSGYYEDTPWTYPVLMSASSVSTLDEVCVHYRQRRQGNILSSTSRKHFDLFDQYDRVFAFLDSHPELAGWRPVIYRRMVDHFGTVFARPGRLPKGSRAEFFRQARAHCRRHHTPDTPATRPRTGSARAGGDQDAAVQAGTVRAETAQAAADQAVVSHAGAAQTGAARAGTDHVGADQAEATPFDAATQAGTDQAGTAQTGAAQAGAIKAEATPSGAAQAGSVQDSAAEAVAARDGASQAGAAQDAARDGAAQSGVDRPGTERPGTERPEAGLTESHGDGVHGDGADRPAAESPGAEQARSAHTAECESQPEPGRTKPDPAGPAHTTEPTPDPSSPAHTTDSATSPNRTTHTTEAATDPTRTTQPAKKGARWRRTARKSGGSAALIAARPESRTAAHLAPGITSRTAPRTVPGTAADDATALRVAGTPLAGTPLAGTPLTGTSLAGPASDESTTGFSAASAPAAPRIAAPSSRTRLRQALVRLGSHRTYRLIAVVRSVRRSFTGLTRAVLRAARAAAMQVHYRIQLRLPVRKNQAVFAAYWNRGYACNPAAVEAKVRELAPHVRTAWITAPAHAHTVPTGTRRLRPGSAAYWSALARAKYLVNNVNFDHRLAKRRGQILVQTQHGTPLKSMGLDLQDRPAATMDFEQLLANTDKWDYLLSSNRHSSLVWGRAYPSPYTTLEHGYPRNDVFQTATAGDVARIRESLNIPEGTTAVLYAPTHRDYRRTQRVTLDLERIARSLGPRHVILTRAHYFSNGPLHRAGSHSSPRIVDVSEHHSIESLCLASDALVTDYSSLMFDYANLNRPIVLHIDDREAYEAARGTYFDIRDFPPGAIAHTEDELIDIFRTGHWCGSRSAQLRAAFRTRFCPYDDGFAAERVVRRVFLGQTEGLPPFVPLEDRTPAPAPGLVAAASVLPTQRHVQTTAQTTALTVADLLPAESR